MMTDEGGARRRALPSIPVLGWGWWLKVLSIALIDAGFLFSLPALFAAESWTLLGLLAAAVLLANYAYLSPRARALKWLTPGLILMALFVAWPVAYTAYVSLTNWATGNSLTKQQAIDNLERRVVRIPGEGVALAMHVFRNPDNDLRFYLVDPEGEVFFGEPRRTDEDALEDPLEDPEALGAVDESGDGIPDRIGEFDRLSTRDLFAIANQLERLVLDVPGHGVAQVQTTTSARLIGASRRFVYDSMTDSLRDTVENQTCPAEVGSFVCPDGRRLDPGWREVIGFDNYARIIGNERIRTPFLGVFAWNIVFALASVALTFGAGLTLASALQHDLMRGRTLYRSVFIVPYAIPAFLSVIVWRGLLNDRFGQVNRLLDVFGIDAIPWLTQGTWAKVAVLMVNTWLGFPYMFLICSGALQAIPNELKEAAKVDGASGPRAFRSITVPLLLVATAPLLIGSFAFNFNNFVLIYLLTEGGPPTAGAAVPVGETDILISFTFNLAVQAGRGNNFALGSAIVVLIFVVVALLAALSFRYTKRLEDVYGNV